MEEAYANVAVAVRGLMSRREADYAKSQAILRSVLQRRPVTLRFALSTLAKSLREGENTRWLYLHMIEGGMLMDHTNLVIYVQSSGEHPSRALRCTSWPDSCLIPHGSVDDRSSFRDRLCKLLLL